MKVYGIGFSTFFFRSFGFFSPKHFYQFSQKRFPLKVCPHTPLVSFCFNPLFPAFEKACGGIFDHFFGFFFRLSKKAYQIWDFGFNEYNGEYSFEIVGSMEITGSEKLPAIAATHSLVTQIVIVLGKVNFLSVFFLILRFLTKNFLTYPIIWVQSTEAVVESLFPRAIKRKFCWRKTGFSEMSIFLFDDRFLTFLDNYLAKSDIICLIDTLGC